MDKNKLIKIGLISVLIYLVFIKTINILFELFIWMNLEIQIENQAVLYILTFIIVVLSLILLSFLYNHYLKNGLINNKSIYELIVLTLLLSLVMGGINYLYPKFTTDIEMGEFRKHYLLNAVWFRSMDIYIPILGLIMFIYKMKLTD